MKTIIKALLCILMINQLAAQNYQGYYYADGVAQYWTDDPTSANIIVGNRQHYNKIVANLKSVFTNAKDEILSSDETD
ncbi:MAG: hypothetical protein LBL18_01655, partial [Bacteroidales bacterium]|nr:hypothetical protein [Bacteroidales bacterium]